MIADATELKMVESEKYDFVLSCMVLEHIANPIKALLEWKRILKPKGALVIIVPYSPYTADHRREITSISHLWEDYKSNINERDASHLDEVLNLYDLDMEPWLNNPDRFREMVEDNYKYRVLHHHVFSTQTLEDLLNSIGFSLIFQKISLPFHIIVIFQNGKYV